MAWLIDKIFGKKKKRRAANEPPECGGRKILLEKQRDRLF